MAIMEMASSYPRPCIAGANVKRFDFGRSRLTERHSWICGLTPYIIADVVAISSFFINLKEQT